ncbi:MAG: UDP-N-acetylmuramoyl-L-alanyl-D-glutamate--2,6-diaminopimelate ligase [Betaproteobacteria bacterium]|nr:UDP-N-acetylmuramoyl-L-alanyl-D-glutamate--2,6-diaminopimelate ligase [Betaproteobacteria bacterium]
MEELGVRRLCTDSRQVGPGDAFIAYPGETRDGRDFIAQAIANGAAAVLWEARGFRWNPAWRVANLGIHNLRRHAGEIASRVCGEPSRKLWVVGVTGTNGKTTCSQWIAQALTRAGRKTAVIGTLGHGFPGALEPTPNTTPDAVWLHAALRDFLARGARAVSMEVSSHGLAQDRLSGVEFDVALLTNLTRDHLEYHRTMRRYRAAKARLFRFPSLRYAVLNLDDRFGAQLTARLRRPGMKVVGYGFGRVPSASGAPRGVLRVRGKNLTVGPHGLAFDVASPWGTTTFSSPLVGRFNAHNLLGSLATLLASEVSIEDSVRTLQHVKPVPGRMQRLGGGDKPLVVIDYAHSPDALQKILEALRELMTDSGFRVPGSGLKTTARRRDASKPGTRNPKLFCVFGCGGGRDRGKRPLMGGIATRLADRVILTSDNPRDEDPRAIIADIAEGTRGEYAAEPDRAAAIFQALREARTGDIVLIAGKGHETYQEIRGARHPFSDAEVAQAGLKRSWS